MSYRTQNVLAVVSLALVLLMNVAV